MQKAVNPMGILYDLVKRILHRRKYNSIKHLKSMYQSSYTISMN